ncbi:MAG: extracellular solute-binding protein [Burkholderiaceae bacterium]
MNCQWNPQGSVERRRFLTTVASASAIAAVPSSVIAKQSEQLHLEVGKRAKALVSQGQDFLRLLIPQGSGDNVKPVIREFENLTGGHVRVSEAPVDDIDTKLILDTLSGKNEHDIALPPTFGLPNLVAANAIITLTDFAKKHEPPDFRNDILYQIGDRFDDELYGFQTDGDVYLLFYHADLLQDPKEQDRYATQFNTKLRVPKTWEELDRQMAFFNRPSEGLAGGLLFRTPGYLAWEWWVRFHAKGLWPLDADLNPQLNAPGGVLALEQMIAATDHLAPEVTRLGLFENWKRYGEGGVYCNIGWGGSQKYLNGPESKMRGRMVYGPTPGGMLDGKLLETPYFNWGWNYVVTANSPCPELSYLFALFASTPAMSTESVRQSGGFFDPFRPEHYQDAQIAKTYSSEFLAVHETSMRAAIPDLYLANRSEYFQTLSRWLDRALLGKISAKDALDNTAQHWALISKRAGLTLQQERWQQLRAKYPADLQARLIDLPA